MDNKITKGGRRVGRDYIKPEPRKEKKFIDLTEKQKAFAQYVVQGMTQEEAYYAAGYLKGKDHKNPKVRKIATNGGYALMTNPIIKRYVYENKALAVAPADGISIQAIKNRLRMIMDCEMFVPAYDKKGNRIQLAPMHKDMINAADLLFKILRWEGDKPKATVGEYELSDDIMEDSTSFLTDIAKSSKATIDKVEAEASPIKGITQDNYEEIVQEAEEEEDNE